MKEGVSSTKNRFINYWNRKTIEDNSNNSSSSSKGILWRSFYMDIRSLALLRVSMASYLLIDIFLRSFYVMEHYSSWGQLPMSISINSGRISLHQLNGSIPFQLFLLMLQACAAFSMLIGYRTRLSTTLSYLFLMSIQNRNHYLLDGSDDYTRTMLFWCIFLPISQSYSLDNTIRNYNIKSSSKQQQNNDNNSIDIENQSTTTATTDQSKYQILGIGNFGFWIQFSCIYLFTALLKDGIEWHLTYDAVYYALNLREFAHGISSFLLQFPEQLRYLTRFTLIFEYLGPILFISPFFNSFCRVISALGFIGMHIGFGVCLNLYLFIFIPMVCVMAFIPSIVWQMIFHYLYSNKDRYKLNIYYDSKSKGYESLLLIFKQFFLLEFTPLIKVSKIKSSINNNNSNSINNSEDDDLWSKLSMDKPYHSIIVQFDSDYYYGFDGFIVMCSQSPILWPFERLFNNNIGYYLFSKPFIFFSSIVSMNYNHNQLSLFSKQKSLPPPSSSSSSNNTISSRQQQITRLLYNLIFILIPLVIVIFLPIMNTYKLYGQAVPMHRVAIIAGLDQNWNMFAPNPPRYSYWLVVDATFDNIKSHDILNHRSFEEYQAPPVYAFTTGQRQRNFIMGVMYQEDLRLGFGRFLCRKYNIYSKNEEYGELNSFKIVTVQKTTAPVGSDMNEYRTQVIWSHECK